MRVEVKLTSPDKEGKMSVKQGDKIWWIDRVPYRFDLAFVPKSDMK